MAEQQVMKEFLVSLGFKLDEAGLKKFRGSLDDSTKQALAVGGALIGAALAVEKFVEAMSDGLEKLYFVSQRTGESVAGIKSLEIAYQDAGLAAGEATRNLDQFKMASLNPGVTEFRKRLIGAKGMAGDPAEQINATIKVLADQVKSGALNAQVAMKEFTLATGIAGEEFYKLMPNIDAVIAQLARTKKAFAEANSTVDGNAKAANEFNIKLRDLSNQFDILSQALYSKLVGPLGKAVDWLTGEIRNKNVAHRHSEEYNKVSPTGGWVGLDELLHWAAVKGGYKGEIFDPQKEIEREAAEGNGATATPGSVQTNKALDQFNDLLNGIAGAEPDQRGSQTVSSAGAIGRYGIMPKTAESFGYKPEDMFDDDKARKVAGLLLTQLLEHFHGNVTQAMMGYNAGQGRVDKALLGQGPALTKETMNYPGRVQSFMQDGQNAITNTQNVNIAITGTGDPQATGNAVGGVIRDQWGTLQRASTGMMATPGGR
jgi:hypothetical protein